MSPGAIATAEVPLPPIVEREQDGEKPDYGSGNANTNGEGNEELPDIHSTAERQRCDVAWEIAAQAARQRESKRKEKAAAAATAEAAAKARERLGDRGRDGRAHHRRFGA